MRTELYISYAFYDKDQIEAVNFSINVLTLSKKAKTLITEWKLSIDVLVL